MRQIIVVVVILLTFSFSVAVGEETIVLKADRLVDVQKGKLVKNATVVIVGNRIESVNPRRLPKESRIIDLGDVTLMPGLMDMHRHLTSIISTATWRSSLLTRRITQYVLLLMPKKHL